MLEIKIREEKKEIEKERDRPFSAKLREKNRGRFIGFKTPQIGGHFSAKKERRESERDRNRERDR